MSGVTVGLGLVGAEMGIKTVQSFSQAKKQRKSARGQQFAQMGISKDKQGNYTADESGMIEYIDPNTGQPKMVPQAFAGLVAARENQQNMELAQADRTKKLEGLESQYQNLAQQGLPDAVERGMEQNIQQGTNQLLRGLQASRSGLRGISGVASQQNQSYQNLAMMDAQARQSATQNYLNFQNQASAEQYGMQQDQIGLNNAFAAQQLGIYNQGQDQINALYGAAQQNMNEGWNTVGDAFGVASKIVGALGFGVGGGNAGGGGGNAGGGGGNAGGGGGDVAPTPQQGLNYMLPTSSSGQATSYGKYTDPSMEAANTFK